MSPRFGLDSTGPISPSAHHAVGSSVAIRYLSRSTWKVVTAAEHRANQAHGIATCLVFEDSAQQPLAGYEQGKADAEWGLKQATDILGASARPAFTLAYDADPTGIDGRTDAYYDGAAAVLRHANTGPYGGYELQTRAIARGFGLRFGTYAWSGGRVADVAQQQYSNDHYVAGVGCDYDHLYPDAIGWFGQWDWDFKPSPPPDPYAIYGPAHQAYAWKGKLIHEGAWVRRYDLLRNRPLARIVAHRRELATLRAGLQQCADRVYFEAHYQGQHPRLPPRWTHNHLGTRYKFLTKRVHGERVHLTNGHL